MILIDSPAALVRALDQPVPSTLRRLLVERGPLLYPGDSYVVAEPGDPLLDLEEALGVPVATNLVDGARYPDPDFAPGWEWHALHPGWHELAYVLSDDGGGALLFVPADMVGVDPVLAAVLDAFPPDTDDTTAAG